MHRLPDAPPTDPDVRDYRIRFLGSDPSYQLGNQTRITPFGAQLCYPYPLVRQVLTHSAEVAVIRFVVSEYLP